ncbi:MAG: 50S ribosomal protein L4 [Deltaproteobacteria bacterium]|jgi:large subunit ribosomal protein L4|nr:50S ribosomal protein L4 [Deltaproteobacteria bacterium]
MPLVDVVNIENEKVGQIELPEDIFEVEIKPHLVHEVVTAQLHSRRAGTACTKTRGELAYSNKKPYRQKKTGRARAGSRRSPLWRGGGTIFGPKPRDFSWRPPSRIRKQALRVVLSAKLKSQELVVVDAFALEAIKTKSFKEVMEKLSLKKAVVVTPAQDRHLELSCRNLTNFKVLRVDGLNCYDLLKYDQLVLLKASLPALGTRLETASDMRLPGPEAQAPAPETGPETDQKTDSVAYSATDEATRLDK